MIHAPTIESWILCAALLSLRIAPVLTFAPPFNLTRLPARFRLLLGLGLAASLPSISPVPEWTLSASPGQLVEGASRELMLGAMLVLAFQLPFAALHMAGRTIDIQSGLGLAVLVDPSTRAQLPLVGTLLANASAALFFAMDGHLDLLRILAASVAAVPLGTWQMPGTLDRLAGFAGVMFLAALGATGAAIGGLFAIDLAVAVLARTVPQMNALVLGFQVKTLALFVLLPLSFGLGGAILLRLMRITLEALPGLVG